MSADARRASEIITRIRAMAAHKAPQPTPLSLHDVIDEALLFLQGDLQSKRISVHLELAPSLPAVLGDRTQLQQVIVNLTVNAAHAIMQADASRRIIAIRTTPLEPRKLACTLEDSGPGIAPEHLDRLFESFFTTKETGMGMGLSICRSIIEGHGGELRAENGSSFGGARFSFTLPAAD
jgi:C4-dicarboxylate-specific signal transduction histidine kinase